MTWVNGRIAASVGTADSYVSFPILYLFIFRKTLVAKIRIIFSDQAHSSLKKRGFAKIQNNDEPSTPTGVLGKRRFLPPYFVGLQQIN